MEIRTANHTDWPRVIEIYNHAVLDGHSTADLTPVTVDDRRTWLEQHNDRYPIRLAQTNGLVIGWCSLSPYRPGREALSGVAEISYYIAREFRGQGVADKLMADAFCHAESKGFRSLIAILLEINRASLKLLRKHGFRKWGELPGVADLGDCVCGQYIYGRKLLSRTTPCSRLTATL